MNEQAYYNGFIKRAVAFGYNYNAAVQLLKTGGFLDSLKGMVGMQPEAPDFPPAGMPGGRVGGTNTAPTDFPQMGQPGGRFGGTQPTAYQPPNPLNQGLANNSGNTGKPGGMFNSGGNPTASFAPKPPMMPPPSPMENASMDQIQGKPPLPPGLSGPSQMVAMNPQPKPQMAQGGGIDFKHFHGTSFNPNSRMDRQKMQALQQAQARGGSLVQAANAPYRRV